MPFESICCAQCCTYGSDEWCSLCDWIHPQHRQQQALRFLPCHPISRTTLIVHWWMAATDGLGSCETRPLCRFNRATPGVWRSHPTASNQKEWIWISHLSILHYHPRIFNDQPPHIIIENQRQLGPSLRGSRAGHCKVHGGWEILGLQVGDDEKCSKHVHLNAQFCLSKSFIRDAQRE